MFQALRGSPIISVIRSKARSQAMSIPFLVVPFPRRLFLPQPAPVFGITEFRMQHFVYSNYRYCIRIEIVEHIYKAGTKAGVKTG